jgi:hypothetical protein
MRVGRWYLAEDTVGTIVLVRASARLLGLLMPLLPQLRVLKPGRAEEADLLHPVHAHVEVGELHAEAIGCVDGHHHRPPAVDLLVEPLQLNRVEAAPLEVVDDADVQLPARELLLVINDRHKKDLEDLNDAVHLPAGEAWRQNEVPVLGSAHITTAPDGVHAPHKKR